MNAALPAILPESKEATPMQLKPAAILGISACAAACAGIVVWPLLAGVGIAGFGAAGVIGGMSAEVAACLAIPAIGLAGWAGWRIARSGRTKTLNDAAACASDGSCGCGSSPATKP